MKLKPIYHHHYFQLASDNYRQRHYTAPFINQSNACKNNPDLIEKWHEKQKHWFLGFRAI